MKQSGKWLDCWRSFLCVRGWTWSYFHLNKFVVWIRFFLHKIVYPALFSWKGCIEVRVQTAVHDHACKTPLPWECLQEWIACDQNKQTNPLLYFSPFKYRKVSCRLTSTGAEKQGKNTPQNTVKLPHCLSHFYHKVWLRVKSAHFFLFSAPSNTFLRPHLSMFTKTPPIDILSRA